MNNRTQKYQQSSTSRQQDPTLFNMSRNNIRNNSGNQFIGKNITYNNAVHNNKLRVKIPYRHGLPSVVKNFHGRELILKNLHEMLENSSFTTILSQVIVGLGGIGKTETAKQYAHLHEKEYEIIIFIVSENVSNLQENFYEIAADFEIKIKTENGELKKTRDVMNKLYETFSQYTKTLIIMDNAEDPKILAADFLPRRSNELLDKIKIIITSRVQNWKIGDYGDMTTIPLGVFSRDEAYNYMKQSLGNTITLTDDEIYEVIEIVGYLPLALRQIVGYIENENDDPIDESSKITLTDYLELFKKQKNILLDSDYADIYNLTIHTTFKLAKEKLKTKHDKIGQRAVEILEMVSYHSPDHIPFKKIFNIKKGEIDWESIRILKNYSLIDSDGDHISMHRLVQSVILLEVENEDKTIREILSLILSKYDDFEIKKYYNAVLKVAIKYESILDDFYKRFPRSPLIEIVHSKDSKDDDIKKASEYEKKRDNYKVIYKMLEMCIRWNKLNHTELLWELMNEKLNVQQIRNVTSLMNVVNSDVKAFLINAFLKRRIEFDVLKSLEPLKRSKEIIPKIKDNLCDYFVKEGKENILITEAVKENWIDIVDILIALNKCDVDFYNDGDNILHVAFKLRRLDIVSILVEKCPCDFDAKNNAGNTSLMMACVEGNADLVEAMIASERCDANLQNNDGDNALHIALNSGHEDLLSIFNEIDSFNFNAQNKKGETVLMLACKLGKNSVQQLINSDKCEPYLKNNEGDTALHLICKRIKNEEISFKKKNIFDYKRVINSLIGKYSSYLNIQNNDGDTPLMISCRYSSFDIVEMLLRQEFHDINVQNNKKQTALHIFVTYRTFEKQFLSILQTDLFHRSDLNVKDKNNETPIDICRRRRKIEAVDLLLNFSKKTVK